MKVKNLHMPLFVLMILTLFVFLPTVSAQEISVKGAFSQTVQAIAVEILATLTPIIATILTGYAVMLAHKVVQYIQSKLSIKNLWLLESIVAIVVKRVENEGLAKAITDEASNKKAYATTLVQEELRSRGLGKLADNVPLIVSAIEAAINDGIHKSYKEINGENVAVARIVR